MKLQDAIRSQLGIQVDLDLDRYQLPDWSSQGDAPVSCSDCKNPLFVFRCPYETSRGKFRYWALVCTSCEAVSTLDQLDESSKKILRKWDSGAKHVTGDGAQTNPGVASKSNDRFKPTVEQMGIVDAAKGGGDLAINALAGTGKTTTLRQIAEVLSMRRGHYVAFNRAIVDEARSKFPQNINCVTAHSLAFRAVGSKYQARLHSPRVSNLDLAIYFEVEPFEFSTHNDSYQYEPAQMANFASRAVWRFCKSIDDEISVDHVQVPPLVQVDQRVASEFRQVTSETAKRMWEDIQQSRGKVKFDHDHYLKMWQLTRPKLTGDIILFDEAQDADPVMLDVVNSQQHAQIIYCGDTFQSIYEWRGAKDALSLVHVDEKLWLTQSFRFGPAIADAANRFLRRLHSPKMLRGLDGLKSEVGEVHMPDAVLCRTNFGAVVSLQEAQVSGRKTALLGSVKEGLQQFARGCLMLIQGARSGHPELAPFLTWQAALDWANDESEELSDTAMLIRLVESFGAGNLLRTLDGVVEEEIADVVISTAHRAKGREWNSVRIAGDFKHPDDMDEDEWKLAYVAVTRAQQILDITQFPAAPGNKPRMFETNYEMSAQSSRKPKVRPPIRPR